MDTDDLREELWREKGRCHGAIQNSVFDLQGIAEHIEYLHPQLAKDLIDIADVIEKNRQRIQQGESRLINLDLEESQQSTANILMALLDRAANNGPKTGE